MKYIMSDDDTPTECDECGALIAPNMVARMTHDDWHRYIEANLDGDR